MNVRLYMTRADGSEVAIETIMPGTPGRGDLITFEDPDRDEDMDGRVVDIHWRDLNGEILVDVITKRVEDA